MIDSYFMQLPPTRKVDTMRGNGALPPQTDNGKEQAVCWHECVCVGQACPGRIRTGYWTLPQFRVRPRRKTAAGEGS